MRRDPEIGTIASITQDGRGIVATAEKKVFVAGALVGEEVRYRVRKRRRNYDEAELMEVLEPSPQRIEARCAVFGVCGGCALQHIDIAEQRDIKSRSLADSLERIGKVVPRRWLPPIVGEEWHYRRRARLAVKDVPRKGRVLVGFRERHAPFVVDMRRCEVLLKPVDSLVEPLSDMIGKLSIRARLPQVEVSVAEAGCALVFRVLDTPGSDDLEVLRHFGVVYDTAIWLQSGGPGSLTRIWPAPESDAPPLTYTLPDYAVEIEFGPVDFVQVNGDVNRQMVHAAIDYLEPRPEDRVLDLFCGIGNFSLPLARKAGEVLGIEGDPALVAQASANAERNGIGNAAFRCADLAAIDGSEDWMRARWDSVLLDPSRNGAADVVGHMRTLGPERIVYVSCHPGTLARDAGTLVDECGYTLEAAGIIDMFPHTAHVESIAVFSL